MELVYVIASNAWGRGYATEAAAAVRDFALRELDQRRLVAIIDPENAASERVAQKAGFGFEREVARPDGATKRLYAFESETPGPYRPGAPRSGNDALRGEGGGNLATTSATHSTTEADG